MVILESRKLEVKEPEKKFKKFYFFLDMWGAGW